MGNKASTVGFSLSEIVDAASNVMEAFAPLYVRAYGNELVRTLQAEAEAASRKSASESKPKYQLEALPVATEPLEKGWMVKLGAIKASWKRRFFVATNEADNYVVYYFERDEHADTPARKKGAILPCGYRVRALRSEAERKQYGEYALCLDASDGRRSWHLRCDSEEERSKWRDVLKLASLRARPPLSDDPVAAAAFCDAYERIRRRLGMWGWYRIDHNECEQLVFLVTSVCRERILPTLLERMGQAPSAKEGGRAMQAALAELDRIVGNVVGAAWMALSDRVASRAEPLAIAAQGKLASICSDMERTKEALRERVGSVLAEEAREALAKARHVIQAFLRPLYKAHQATVMLFWTRMNDILDRGLKERELRAFFRNCRWQRGELLPAFRRVRAVTRGELPEDEVEAASVLREMPVTWAELVELLNGVTLWEVERILEESLVAQATWGVYTFVAAVETSSDGSDPVESLRAVTRKMAADAVVRSTEDLSTVLRLVFSPQVRRRAMRRPAVQEALRTSALTTVELRNAHLRPPRTHDEEDSAAAALDSTASDARGAASAEAAAASSSASSSSSASAASAAPGSGAPAAASTSGPGSVAPAKVGGSTRPAEKAVSELVMASSSAIGDEFNDAGWALDELVDAAVDEHVLVTHSETISATLNALKKLPGRLGI